MKTGSFKNQTENNIKQTEGCLFKLKKWLHEQIQKFKPNKNPQQQNPVMKALETCQNNLIKPSFEIQNKKKLLVLDLDETLVFTTQFATYYTQYKIEVVKDSKVQKYQVYLRNGYEKFISTMSQHYELCIFTASEKEYADELLKLIDPENQIIQRYYRQDCLLESENIYVKDLQILKRDLKDVIIIDNDKNSFKLQPENGIEIIPYRGRYQERYLELITPFLIYISDQDDVRPVEWQKQQFYENEQARMRKIEATQPELLKSHDSIKQRIIISFNFGQRNSEDSKHSKKSRSINQFVKK